MPSGGGGGGGGAKKAYQTRLKKEYRQIRKSPPPHVRAAPLPSNLLEWHYCVHSLADCPYQGGYYHGKLIFREEYPYKPPSILMITPNGRFATNTRLCLSMSDFHPEAWNPSWSVELILKGLVSFMLESTPTAGSITTTDARKRELAQVSGATNLENALFCDLFPDLVERIRADLGRNSEASALENSSSSSSSRAAAVNNASGGGSGGSGGNSVTPAMQLALVATTAVLAFAIHVVFQNVEW